MSDKVLWGANCATEQVRLLALVAYSQPFGKGSVIVSHNEPGKWVYVVPESMNEITLKALCGKRQ
jgi:hypothetical protein